MSNPFQKHMNATLRKAIHKASTVAILHKAFEPYKIDVNTLEKAYDATINAPRTAPVDFCGVDPAAVAESIIFGLASMAMQDMAQGREFSSLVEVIDDTPAATVGACQCSVCQIASAQKRDRVSAIEVKITDAAIATLKRIRDGFSTARCPGCRMPVVTTNDRYHAMTCQPLRDIVKAAAVDLGAVVNASEEILRRGESRDMARDNIGPPVPLRNPDESDGGRGEGVAVFNGQPNNPEATREAVREAVTKTRVGPPAAGESPTFVIIYSDGFTVHSHSGKVTSDTLAISDYVIDFAKKRYIKNRYHAIDTPLTPEHQALCTSA